MIGFYVMEAWADKVCTEEHYGDSLTTAATSMLTAWPFTDDMLSTALGPMQAAQSFRRHPCQQTLSQACFMATDPVRMGQ